MILWVQIFFNCRDLNFFFYQDFVSRKLTTYRTAGEGRGHLLFHHTTSTCSRTFRHLCGTLYVRWLSHIFNRITCVYQTATRWDLPPYRVTIWLIDWLIDDVTLSFRLISCWFDFSLFLTTIWDGKPVDSNSHRLLLLYYKRTY